MKILDIKVMRGPNYWSIRRHKLIVMKLDLEELEDYPTNKIEGFAERLERMFPTMYSHHCSEGREGGFFSRVREGTWMGHVIEHIALELQTLAGMDTGFGRTRSTGGGPGLYHVVFSYIEEEAGVYAAKAAVEIAEAIILNKQYDLENDIQRLREIREDVRLGPSTGALVEEAQLRKIPFIRLNNRSLVQLGYGMNQKRIQATVASTTSSIAVEIACDKEDTKNLLESFGIPVPKGRIVYNEQELRAAVDRIGYPLVLKPVNGNHGRGATTNIQDWETAVQAFALAQRHSKGVIAETFIQGYDYRLLVVNYRFVAAAKRTPAMVVGDGISTIQALIDKENTNPKRGYGHENVLTLITVDDMTRNILKDKGLTLENILPAGEELYLKTTANLSTGGTATDVTDLVHPYNVFMAERITRIIGLDICGIDVMAPDISVPINENGGAVLEVNAAPGFRMHIAPTEGLPRNVAEPVIDMLYPPGSSARIPIIAITGTNGKTTTTRLIAHIVKDQGYKVGFTTTEGVYIQNRKLVEGDCTGPWSTEFVLKDPTVNFAVLEVARGGILRAGLGFHRCDVGVVTNVAADHLGLQDIYSVEQMAKVKAVVPESVMPTGYAVLNADNDYTYKMAEGLDCQVAFFSMDENNPRIKRHTDAGGYACVFENGYVTICKGSWKIRVDKVANIPITFGGRASFMIENVLAATLATFVQGIKIEDIRHSLQTFIPSPSQTPGRMNLFQMRHFQVMVDYAHNPHGFKAVAQFLSRVNASVKVGIITGVGDRRDEDIIELGELAAEMFNEVIIRQDRHTRGRPAEEIKQLLEQGIQTKEKALDKPIKITYIHSELDAVKYALENAVPGAFVMICSDVVPAVIDYVKRFKEEQDMAPFIN